MIDPELTKVLGRRILASLINMVCVAPLSLMVLASSAQTFSITQRDSSGVPVFSRFGREGLRLADLSENYNRAADIGDTFYVWDTGAIIISLLTVGLLALVVWVLIPASIGWSPGHRMMGLKVVTLDGHEPPLDGYLRRFVVGLIDLFPYVIPGLMGWFVASRNEHNRRIGDLSADTVVIDANSEVKMIDSEAYVSRKNQMVTVEDALPDMSSDKTGSVDPAKAGAAAAGLGAAGASVSGAAVSGAAVSRADVPAATSTFSPDKVVAEAAAAQASPWTKPVEEIQTDDLYIPTHIDTPSELEAEIAESEAAAPTDTSDNASWEKPVSEPAPVWEPEEAEPATTDLDTDPFGSSSGSPDQADAGSTEPTDSEPAEVDPAPASFSDEISATEESAGQAKAEVTQQEQTQPQEAAAKSTSSTTAGGSKTDPTWSEEWQAWLFWDHVNQQWLRHVEADDTWVPIS